MFRILVTDATYKHSIALAQYAKSEIPDLYIIGHTGRAGYFAKCHSCFDSIISGVPLAQALEQRAFDMVIPVGGTSVLTVADVCPQMSVLPERSQIEVCYDKHSTMELGRKLGVPVPRSWYLEKTADLSSFDPPFPCVVKPAREATVLKTVAYCHNPAELAAAATAQLRALDGTAGVLVQEFVTGVGCGFFALMQGGAPMRIFMHQRIREFPPSGGRSTAARAFFSDRLKDLGLRLLQALNWRGVAMVEFKANPQTNDFILLEINAKFWGSLELALSAGVNFGADLIRMFRGEQLEYSEQYDRSHEFYWPLDDDILTLWQTRSLGRISDYWRKDAHTNLLHSVRADVVKSLRFAKLALLG